MLAHHTIAAVDLGSNSFRLQVARVVEEQIYPLDSLKETVRLGAGLNSDGYLTAAAQDKALAALARFGERLRGMPASAVRVVGTNTLRIAKNAPEFMVRAEGALGFPIEIVAGREEARLIYLGAAHSLPATREKRLVVDIGGGSTEFIIGSGFKPLKTESLHLGCVSWSLRYFPDGKLSKQAFRDAELAARAEIQAITAEFGPEHWQLAIGTSGTARSLSDIMELNDLCNLGICGDGMDKLRGMLIKAGSLDAVQLNGLRPDRRLVLPGGFAIMAAIFAELKIERMNITLGALRDGVLYDLIGRQQHKDMRESTVLQFKRRYHADAAQAERVARLAETLYRQLAASLGIDAEPQLPMLRWAAWLHEIGLSIGHTGYHKHSAYILQNADMPGFSRQEQARLALQVLGHKGGLSKLKSQVQGQGQWAKILALRLAVLACRSRRDRDWPELALTASSGGFNLRLASDWLADNPLTHTALQQEAREWADLGLPLSLA